MLTFDTQPGSFGHVFASTTNTLTDVVITCTPGAKPMLPGDQSIVVGENKLIAKIVDPPATVTVWSRGQEVDAVTYLVA